MIGLGETRIERPNLLYFYNVKITLVFLFCILLIGPSSGIVILFVLIYFDNNGEF